MSMQFGQYLKEFREQNQFSQSELAHELNQEIERNYTASNISKWERGECEPSSVAIVTSLEELLGISNQQLVRRSKYAGIGSYELTEINIESQSSKTSTTGNTASERKKEHFEKLINLLKILVHPDLDELQLNPLRGNSESGIGENKYVTGYSDDGGVISDDSELVRRLSENFEYMFQQTDSITLSGLTAHLKEEFPSMGRKNIESYALQDPFNFIKKINLLIHRGIIKGKCEICEGL